jgi:hypothetical protein
MSLIGADGVKLDLQAGGTNAMSGSQAFTAEGL